MFLESSPSESFIKSSSLSELESQSFVEEKTKSFWVITSLQSKSFSTPSLSFRRKSSKSFNESFVEETKSFCLMIYEVGSYYPQKICSYPHRFYEASLSLKKSFTKFFFWKKKSKSFVAINVFLIKEISVFHNPGIIICYGKEKNNNQEMNSTREKSQATIKLNIQIVWNWNSKIQGLKTKKQTKRVWVPKLKCQNKTEKNIIKNTTIKSIKQKNEKIEEKSNLNLTPHTTVFHQFPIEAMIGPGTELALKQYSVFQEINSFKCLSLLYLSALLRGVVTNMVCATPSVSSSIRRFYACNDPPLPPSPSQIPSSL